MAIQLASHARWVLFTFAILILPLSPAAAEILFGPEFTFTNRDIIQAHERNPGPEDGVEFASSNISNRHVRRWQRLFRERMRTYCQECQILGHREIPSSLSDPEFRVIHHARLDLTAWWYEITTDPAVVEIKASPQSLETWARLRHQVQDEVFDTAHRIGVDPHPTKGGGHVNIGFSVFAANPLLLRNFIVDYQNHPTLGIASLGNDPRNAAPIGLLSSQVRRAFAEVIYEFDQRWSRHLASDENNLALSLWLVEQLNTRVYTENWQRGYSHLTRYQAINLKNIRRDVPQSRWRVEMRAHRPQRHMDEWLMLITLYDQKIRALERLNRPIALKSDRELAIQVEIGPRSRLVLSDPNPHRARLELQSYVQSAGLNADAYLRAFL